MPLSGHATWSWTSTGDLTEIAEAAAAVAVAVESASPADWPRLQEVAHALVTAILEQAAAGALDVTDAGSQIVLAVLIYGVLQTLTALTTRRLPPA